MDTIEKQWSLVSGHGSVLFYIAVCPGCTTKDIADAMSLTRRTVWGVIGDLRRKKMINVRKEGRRHHYTVNLNDESRFTHPIMDWPMNLVLGGIVHQHSK